jgi:hypothetical protein
MALLDKRIEKSVRVLKLAAEMSREYYGKPMIICYSGGKDSDVLLHLAETYLGKEDFEVLILKKFKMYRIGYQTMTAFKNALEVKLNEVMPKYNKMFNMLDGWDLFNDGERETRNVIDSRNTNSTSSSNGTNISDRRYSELPQNRLQDVQDGKYITDYNYDTDTNSMTGNNSINDNGTLNETINRSPSDKIKLYKEFQDDVKSIYTMIFNDLDDLFYGLVM